MLAVTLYGQKDGACAKERSGGGDEAALRKFLSRRGYCEERMNVNPACRFTDMDMQQVLVVEDESVGHRYNRRTQHRTGFPWLHDGIVRHVQAIVSTLTAPASKAFASMFTCTSEPRPEVLPHCREPHRPPPRAPQVPSCPSPALPRLTIPMAAARPPIEGPPEENNCAFEQSAAQELPGLIVSENPFCVGPGDYKATGLRGRAGRSASTNLRSSIPLSSQRNSSRGCLGGTRLRSGTGTG